VTAVYNRMRDDDQRRIDETRRHGIDERWRRRAFYTDEEDGATAPSGYQRDPTFDDDLSDDEVSVEEETFDSHPPSPRSRSSSKVRFQDDLTDDYDVRSNPSTSSRSIPVGERWGGFEIPEVEKDVGKEILYQVTQQGFNELLDILFKPKEDLLMEVFRTRADRKFWAHEIELLEKSGTPKLEEEPKEEEPKEEEPKEEEPKHPRNEEELEEVTQNRSLDELLQRAGYAVQSPNLESVNSGPVLEPTSPRALASDDSLQPTHVANPDHEDGLGQSHPFEDHSDTASATSSDANDQAPISEAASSRDPSDEDEPVDDIHRNPDFDPTLPQFRPDAETTRPHLSFRSEPSVMEASAADASPQTSNSDLPDRLRFEPNGTISLPAPSSPHSSSPEAEATAPKPPPSPMQPLPPPKSAKPHGDTAGPHKPPQRILARWAYLNQVERESKERGGSGAKLNFDEFSRRMAADKGRRLAFVASWIEMASF
jgi:hypothetical protein